MITLGNILTPLEMDNLSIRDLNINDVGFIVTFNLTLVILWYLLSITGFLLILIGKLMFSIGQGLKLAGMDSIRYYLSSFTHGFGELLVGCIVFCFTIKLFKTFIGYIIHKKMPISISELVGSFV